jgi:hypothetical protein
LVVIGVHTPEFAFEHDIENVCQAAKDLRVDYPIAIDNGYALWRAFKNQYWPVLYVVDAQGRIRHHYFGEGAYAQSERMIQHLLAEAGLGGLGHELVVVEARGAVHGMDVDDHGHGTVTAPRLYQLIRQRPPIADCQFEIEFLDTGVEAFALTFG